MVRIGVTSVTLSVCIQPLVACVGQRNVYCLCHSRFLFSGFQGITASDHYMKSALLANQQWSSVVLQCLRETNCEHQVHLHVLELSAANPSKVRGEMELPITGVLTVKQQVKSHLDLFSHLASERLFSDQPFLFSSDFKEN